MDIKSTFFLSTDSIYGARNFKRPLKGHLFFRSGNHSQTDGYAFRSKQELTILLMDMLVSTQSVCQTATLWSLDDQSTLPARAVVALKKLKIQQ